MEQNFARNLVRMLSKSINNFFHGNSQHIKNMESRRDYDIILLKFKQVATELPYFGRGENKYKQVNPISK